MIFLPSARRHCVSSYTKSSNLMARQTGFTLLEVLVAMTLIGIGFASAFVAISGSRRLTEKALAHESAMTLARAKLDEVVFSKDSQLSDDVQEDRYAGQAYGYQIKVRPVDVPLPEGLDKAALPFVLEDLAIEVFWGPQGKQQSYRLSTMRMTPKPAAAGTSAPAAASSAPARAASQPAALGRIP